MMLNCNECDYRKECDAKSKYDDIMQTCTDFKAFVNEIRADERRKVLDELTIYMLNSCKDVKCREDITIDNDFDFYASELLDIFEEFKKPMEGAK